MKYSVTVTGSELLTLAEVKAHLKTLPGDTAEDAAVIAPLITAAREYCEGITGCALIGQTVTAYPDEFLPVMRMPRTPITQVTSIAYTDSDGVTAYITDYESDTDHIAPGEIPTFAPTALNPIAITYEAGCAQLPATLRQAMLLLIGHWYVNRSAVEVGAIASIEVQLTVDRLLKQWKAWWY